MIIVSRHQGLVDWLAQRGIVGDVISHASPDDVRDKNVFGVLPLHLAALAKSVTVVDMPDLPADWRGKDITPDQMDQAGAYLTRYVVKKKDTRRKTPSD